MNGGSPGRAGRWAFRSGLRPSLQAQRPELNYKDNSFNLFLPLRVYFYECSNGKQYGEDGQITYEGKFLCGKPEEEFKRSPEYSAYLKKEEERKAKKAAEALKAKKKAKDEKNSKIGCIIIIIIVIILASIS